MSEVALPQETLIPVSMGIAPSPTPKLREVTEATQGNLEECLGEDKTVEEVRLKEAVGGFRSFITTLMNYLKQPPIINFFKLIEEISKMKETWDGYNRNIRIETKAEEASLIAQDSADSRTPLRKQFEVLQAKYHDYFAAPNETSLLEIQIIRSLMERVGNINRRYVTAQAKKYRDPQTPEGKFVVRNFDGLEPSTSRGGSRRRPSPDGSASV